MLPNSLTHSPTHPLIHSLILYACLITTQNREPLATTVACFPLQAWLWCHPAIYKYVLNELRTANDDMAGSVDVSLDEAGGTASTSAAGSAGFSASASASASTGPSSATTVDPLAGGLVRFTLLGRTALDTLTAVLRPAVEPTAQTRAQTKTGTQSQKQTQSQVQVQGLAQVQTQTSSSESFLTSLSGTSVCPSRAWAYGAVLAVAVQDPRLVRQHLDSKEKPKVRPPLPLFLLLLVLLVLLLMFSPALSSPYSSC